MRTSSSGVSQAVLAFAAVTRSDRRRRPDSTTQGSLPLLFQIVELEPLRVFTDEAKLPGARMGHEHRIERSGDRATIRNRLYIDGRLSGFYATLLGRRMSAAVERMVELEKRLAEEATLPEP